MAAWSIAIDLKDSLGPSLRTALYAIAPRLPWIAGIPLVALASLGSLGVTIGARCDPQVRALQQGYWSASSKQKAGPLRKLITIRDHLSSGDS
jgi:hypothetical protein